MARSTADLATPALIVGWLELKHNIEQMAAALPGPRLRPHVKAHKCTSLARLQAAAGHGRFTCATVQEVVGMARAGFAEELLLANTVLDTQRLRGLDVRVVVAVDSLATIEAAARVGLDVLIDVNVGLNRCGCKPEDAGRLADAARKRGLCVRGVMGYEGHVVHELSRAARQRATEQSMALLASAHGDVGGEIVSAGGTGTYDCNTVATEIQAGSYVLMDTDYARLQLPFKQAMHILATVVHRSADRAVIDCGLKALGMDAGPPTIDSAEVVAVSDEHTILRGGNLQVGARVKVWPAHVDPTVAYHERMHIVEDDAIRDVWPVDLRGW